MTSPPRLAEVRTLYESNFRDVPATLRNIADEIEAGRYGTVNECAIAMLGQRLEVFGMGPTCDAGSVVLLLHAAINKMARPIEEYGS